METTENIEKSMQVNHGVCVEEYERSLKRKLEVEEKRYEDHRHSQILQQELNNKLF
ncbi:hypothetical protein [Salsuginibacillus kocurii]|uniref:hypothetical protein n=1 Tax=Salsuginibacillus kocurii TaxID=427078 RepID=UPI0003657F01|nr:hypothetical protein [Salsuginibacillus kocurii]